MERNTVDLSNTRFLRKYIKKKGMEKSNKKLKILYKCITANTNVMWHTPPINLFLLAAKQEPHKKTHLLMKNTEEFSGKSSEE